MAHATRPRPSTPQTAAAHTPITDVMTEDPVAVPEDLPVDQLVELLLEHGLSRVPVIDPDRRPIGVVSKTDLVLDRYVRDDAATAERAAVLVRDVMTPVAESLPASASLADATRRMVDLLLHAMPVVSDRGRLIGIVTASDVVAWVAGVRLPPG